MRVNSFLSGGALPPHVRGTKCDQYIHVADIYATLAEAAGISSLTDTRAAAAGLPPLDSISMWKLLTHHDPHTRRYSSFEQQGQIHGQKGQSDGQNGQYDGRYGQIHGQNGQYDGRYGQSNDPPIRREMLLATPSLKWGNLRTAPWGERASEWSYQYNSAGALIAGDYKLIVGVNPISVWTG